MLKFKLPKNEKQLPKIPTTFEKEGTSIAIVITRNDKAVLER
jgi:hypothetical protein